MFLLWKAISYVFNSLSIVDVMIILELLCDPVSVFLDLVLALQEDILRGLDLLIKSTQQIALSQISLLEYNGLLIRFTMLSSVHSTLS